MIKDGESHWMYYAHIVVSQVRLAEGLFLYSPVVWDFQATNKAQSGTLAENLEYSWHSVSR